MANPITAAWRDYQAGADLRKDLAAGYPQRYGSPWWWSQAGSMRQLRTVGDGAASSIVVACMLVWEDSLQEAPLQVVQPPDDQPAASLREWEPLATHRLVDLWERPNQYMTSDDLWAYIAWARKLDGNAYLYKQRNARGLVEELWPIRPDLMKPSSPDDGSRFLDHWEYRPRGEAIPLEVDDVIHLKHGIDRQDHRLGMAPLKATLKEVLTDEEAARYTAALMSNNAIPFTIITPKDPEGRITDGARLLDLWRDKFGGDRRGEPFINDRALQIDTAALNPEQLNLKQLRRIPEERIAADLGVPLILAGLGAGLETSSGRNESQTLLEEFTRRRVVPDWRRTERQLRWQLLPDVEQTSLLRTRYPRFDTSAVGALQEDRVEAEKASAVSLRGGGITIADHKRRSGLKPADDGSDDVYLIPISAELVPADQLGARAATVPVADPVVPVADPDDEPPDPPPT